MKPGSTLLGSFQCAQPGPELLDACSIVRQMRTNARASRPSANFARLVLETASSAGEKAAVIEPGREASYDWLVGRALAFAETLEATGVRPGDRVAILLPRGADSAAAFFGTLARGAVSVVIDETLRPRQIEHIVNHSGARVLLTSTDLVARLSRPLDTPAQMLELGSVPDQGSFAPCPRIEQ